MAEHTWDIETETVITNVNMKREKVPCEPRLVRRNNCYGKFATLRQGQEYLRGRILWRGKYYSREEIAEVLQKSREWRGALVERTETGWRFRLGTAELNLRAA